jgi:hypothetical protein
MVRIRVMVRVRVRGRSGFDFEGFRGTAEGGGVVGVGRWF